MRDLNRIDPIIDNLRALWKKQPDMRLTQLIVNYFGGNLGNPPVPDFWYQEDHITALNIKAELQRNNP